MDKITIARYDAAQRVLWDDFVENARNATFLFKRDYMDYHADRFADCSLLAWSGGKLLAVLPADLSRDGILRSHGGLTYGGWILPKAHLDATDLLEIFETAVEYCRGAGISGISYKPLPYIYALYPSQEDIYALFRLGGAIDCVNLSSAVDLLNPRPFNTLQRRLLRKAGSLPFAPKVESSPMAGDYDVAPFWNMLADCLDQRHDARPVHSLEELQMLRDRFPSEIRIFMVRDDVGIPVAGVCVFESAMVAHCQYICTTARGRSLNLLPFLFDYLINRVYAKSDGPASDSAEISFPRKYSPRYFDFGTSNEEAGRILNAGLHRQKSSFGATGVAYPRYFIPVTSPLS